MKQRKVYAYNPNDSGLVCCIDGKKGKKFDLHIWKKGDGIERVSYLDVDDSVNIDLIHAAIFSYIRSPITWGRSRTIYVEKELKLAICKICINCKGLGRISTGPDKWWYNEDCPVCKGRGKL